MRISKIDKEYTKSESMSAKAYVAVDSESEGTGKMEVSELSETVILEYGDDSTYDAVLAMLNAGKRVLVNVDPFFSNDNAIGSDGVQKYPISPYKVLLQANIPTGNPYIDFTGYISGSVVQVAHVSLWNSSVPSMPSKINNWCVKDVNPTELAKKSELNTLASRVNALEANGGGSSGGYGSDEFIVNFSLDTNNNVVADKTHDEIKQCFDANGMESFKIIKGVYMGRLFNLLFAADHQTPWTFECPIVTVINGAPTLSYAMITITNTNEVSFTAQQYTLQTVSEV